MSDSNSSPREGEKGRKRSGGKSRTGRRIGYTIAIAVNILLIWIVSSLLDWRVPYLTENFAAPQYAISASLMASIAINLLFLAFDPPWFRHLLKIVQNAFAFFAIYVLNLIFPFNFPESYMSTLARVVLIIMMVAIVVGSIVELVKLIRRRE